MTEKPMAKLDLAALTLDELWELHEQITTLLSAGIMQEKRELEKRLVKLNASKIDTDTGDHKRKPGSLNPARPRREYPKVLPKYRNPDAPFETWSGRGKQPRWLVSALEAGGRIDDFKIDEFHREKADAEG